jgi:acetyltransferase-like isoleucine patch superfamily enzyme
MTDWRKNIFRRIFNRLLHILARFSPGQTTFRPFLHKLRGVKIQGRVYIGEDVYLENEFPERVEIHDQAVITLRSIIMAHGRGEGRVIIKEKARVGPNAVVAVSGSRTLTIGEGAVVATGSVVNKDVPPYTLVSGVPAEPVARITVPLTINNTYEKFVMGLRPLKKGASKTTSGKTLP